ncbi:MAG: hypothetical protein AB1755_04245 [Candidatus Omnitrophota bacterium]
MISYNLSIYFLYKNMKKLNSLQVEQILRKKQISFFTPRDFMRLFGAPLISVNSFLNRHTKNGIFIKVRNGLYLFKENSPPKFLIANKLYEPSYISFETALSYYHIIPETIYTIFSATTKASREYGALDTRFIYHRIKKSYFHGYEPKIINNLTVYMAEPEKALIDYLYFVDLKKKNMNIRINTAPLSYKKLLAMAKSFNRKNLLTLINQLYVK